jgi:pimeloyl-ACP methyl ester carboxylesterase
MRKKLIISLGVLTVFLFTLDSCMQFRMSTAEIDERFASTKTSGIQATYQYQKRTMHYAKTGRENGPIVLFVHGSPGSLSDFIQFLTDTTLQKRAQLLSVDRPGFGQSNFGRGEPSLEQQSKMIKPLIESYKKAQPVILVGHSLGGPLIAQMAADYPELIDGLVFVAASVDPELEPPNWWRAPFATSFFRWTIPRSIRASNDEIYPLKMELEELSSRWEKINASTTVIHGTKDSLVPFGNATFIENKLRFSNPTMVFEEGMDHFVPWSHPHLIKRAVVDMLNSIQ